MINQGTWSSLASTLLDLPAHTEKSAAKFLIVGIGTSAHSQQALERLFKLLPANTGACFVVVQDLPAEHPSHLVATLQSMTKMQVTEATDQLRVKANCVYTIPANQDMRIVHGALTLSLRDESPRQHLPIDTFFSALASDQKRNAVGIMLSGTGKDGSRGFAVLNNAGSTTIAHQAETDGFNSVHGQGRHINTIQAGEADHIFNIENIVHFLSAGKALPMPPPTASKEADSYAQILAQLLTSTGVDFNLYKKSTIERCIQRAMVKHNISEIAQYPAYLKDNPVALNQLFKELLINVTQFFRDAEAFEVMEKVVLPQLLKNKTDKDSLRIWVPACASGEEAYSIAILVREYLARTQQQLQVKIYSTDIDEDAISTARAAIYPSSVALDVSAERLHNFFVKHEAGYRIKKEIREMVVFAVQNVIKDPPFIKLDLISCRNLMIYLELSLQKRILSMFHYALNPAGILLLSPSESIGNHTDLFRAIDRKWKFYQAIHHQLSNQADVNNLPLPTATNQTKEYQELNYQEVNYQEEKYQPSTEIKPSTSPAINYAALSRQLLIQCFAPTSIITNVKGDILHIHGESANYLQPLTAQGSNNIIELAHDGLAWALRNAIQAVTNDQTFIKADIPYHYNGESILLHLSVRKLTLDFSKADLNKLDLNKRDFNKRDLSNLDLGYKNLGNQDTSSQGPSNQDTSNQDDFLLLSFEPELESLQQPPAAAPATIYDATRIETLELELTSTKETLYAVIEEQNATNEEFRATTEELQSANEELQSFNQELVTVNSELLAKIQHLSHSHTDMQNLHENINIATIFLDTHMQVRRFTPGISKIYRLIHADVGRPLNDIKSSLVDDNTLTDAENVLETLVSIEREISTRENEWYLMRIQPYRTMDNVVDGVIMTFIDITSRIHTENVAIETYDLMDNIVNTIREPILVLNRELKITSTNKAFCQYFHATFMDTIGHFIYDLERRHWDIPALRVLLEIILPQEQVVNDYFIEHDFPHIGHRQLSINGRFVTDKFGEPSLILLTMSEMRVVLHNKVLR